MPDPSSNPVLIEKFWESIPPAWRITRNQIRRIAVEKFQMTEEQFQVLRRIHRGSTSVSSLAEASQTSRSAVSKAVDSLVHKGLVARQQDLADRRNIPLALTEEGQRVLDAIFMEAEAWLAARFACLTPEETNSLLQGMENLQKVFLSSH
jgi:MarR family transcriptional regulator, 2-MHQ and catechol-resistance regulon repressor